ncbi:MAG TPA: aminotransferase class III-fold pyridoxal phosphate-dependent enzyme [Candidatus Saccharimonadales bacterium]|nr:aminotransferase class III-fold pyridoxal phosphate-dependent enzyme [Candidatus Saccharimonadales bacterium]
MQTIVDNSAPADFESLSRPHLSPILGRYFDRSWDHGEGHYLVDTAGRRYLDFACGIATTSLGHRHPAVTRAIHEQADKLLHICNALGYLEPVGRLAELISDVMPGPLDTVFFANSGAEAIEGGLKLARRVTGRPGLIAFSNGFHGRTFGAASVTTSNINYRTGYEPLLPSVYIAKFPNTYHDGQGSEERATEIALADLRRIFTEEIPPKQVAGIVIEAVQGEGGYYPAPARFLREIRKICDEHGILYIADEVQCGYARTGRMWGFQHADVVPDVVCLAKAIANGLPLSAIVTRRELQERWGVGAHGSTFGGNPVACAAGVAVLETIRDEGLVANAAERGAQLNAGLKALMADDHRIGDVRGPGLMIGVEFVRDRATRAPDTTIVEPLLAACIEAGLIVLSAGKHHQVVRFIPPLDGTAEEIDQALAIFRRALASIPPAPVGAGA